MFELGADLAGLQAMTEAGGGTLNLASGDLRDLLQQDIAVERTKRTELWPFLVLAAMILWPIDLGLRRLAGAR